MASPSNRIFVPEEFLFKSFSTSPTPSTTRIVVILHSRNFNLLKWLLQFYFYCALPLPILHELYTWNNPLKINLIKSGATKWKRKEFEYLANVRCNCKKINILLPYKCAIKNEFDSCEGRVYGLPPDDMNTTHTKRNKNSNVSPIIWYLTINRKWLMYIYSNRWFSYLSLYKHITFYYHHISRISNRVNSMKYEKLHAEITRYASCAAVRSIFQSN